MHNFLSKIFLDLALCNYIRAHIIKITGSHKGNLSAIRIVNSVTQFFCIPKLLVHACTTVVKKHAPRDTFSKTMNLIVYIPEMSFSYLQNLSIFFPSGKYKFQFVPF